MENNLKAATEIAALQLREDIFKEAEAAIRGQFYRGLKIGLTIGVISVTVIVLLIGAIIL